MAFLNYEYKMIISYSEPVDKCYFTIKSIPTDDFRQRSIAYNITVLPTTQYSMSKDSFGNVQLIGCEGQPHSVFEFDIKGLVETQPINISSGIHKSIIGMYKYPHGKCLPGEKILAFAKELREELSLGVSSEAAVKDNDICRYIMNRLYERMIYEPGSTAIETTAEEAFSAGKGVCQDYSHIFITLLRLFGIPARYVCGLIVGEGESHAWVEAACEGNFIAFDPTHNAEVSDEYIKLGVGRDATDCTINRGVMWGGGVQTQEIKVTVDKYY